MHDIRFIRENSDAFDQALKRRGLPAAGKEILAIDAERRTAQTQMQELQAKRNDVSKQIGEIKKKGGDAAALMQEVAAIKDKIAAAEEQEKQLGAKLNDILSSLPNMPAADVPDGKDEKDNKEIRRSGEPKKIAGAKQHFEIGEKLGLMDFETAAKLSGARFTMLKGPLAKLERALGNFMLDIHAGEFGYTEISPPLMVRDEIMYGTGQLPKFQDDLFEIFADVRKLELKLKPKTAGFAERDAARLKLHMVLQSLQSNMEWAKSKGLDVSWSVETFTLISQIFREYEEAFLRYSSEFNALTKREEDLKRVKAARPFLIPTSEVPLTNIVNGDIVEREKLPFRFTAKTPCFRAEAGAAGKDTRGMLRQHQFYKVEMVSIVAPDQSEQEHERMTACAETILKKLELPFRTVVLCAGDMGFAARKTYDIEVWLPGQNAYREISSCSNCGDFQARRMNARCRRAGDKNTEFVHTLNGSGVAVGRCLIAIMENFQESDGSITIPPALRPYMGGMEAIR